MRLDGDDGVFASMTVPYVRKSMFYSEVFLFLAFASAHNATLVVESGVKNGLSTRLIAPHYPVIAVDQSAPLCTLPHAVQFHLGDARTMVPALVASRPDDRIAVLIDGPKGLTALRLKDQCLAMPNVIVVALHDQPIGQGESLHSHDDAVQAQIACLDVGVEEGYRAKYPRGPGLAVWTTTNDRAVS
jgi:hypothetical protein